MAGNTNVQHRFVSYKPALGASRLGATRIIPACVDVLAIAGSKGRAQNSGARQQIAQGARRRSPGAKVWRQALDDWRLVHMPWN